MSKLFNWLKSFFVKAQPVIERVEPIIVDVATKSDPTLAPKIVIATAAYGAIRGILHEEG